MFSIKWLSISFIIFIVLICNACAPKVSINTNSTNDCGSISQNTTYYQNEGAKAEANGQINKAIYYYTLAVEDSPCFAKGFFDLAYLLYTIGKKDEAIENYSKYIEINPNNTQAYNNRGFI